MGVIKHKKIDVDGNAGSEPVAASGSESEATSATYRAPLEIVKELYAKLTAGDPSGALALMSDDIEWITMMDYKVAGRGPQKVLEGMLMPAMEEWEPHTLTPHEFICDGDKRGIVSVGGGSERTARPASTWRSTTLTSGK
ncbi:nuclear transport factor 2 family protein [Mycobacterium kiyosense]|nr:hypothetical protein IWGMT90018_18930 [Mycobacterium kiyosense]